MVEIISVLQAAPVVAQANSFAQLAKNITNTTDPISTSLTASKLIIGVCTPRHIQFPLRCGILAAQLRSGGLTSVTSTALLLGTGKQIFEELS